MSILILVIFLSGCASCSFNENRCTFNIEPISGTRIQWRKDLPVTLRIHEDIPEAAHVALVNAADRWNEAAGRDLLIIHDKLFGSDNMCPSRDFYNVIYFAPSPCRPLDTKTAYARNRIRSNKIVESDVVFNDFGGFFPGSGHEEYFSIPHRFYIDLESVAVHEFGHVLGLQHSDYPESVMGKSLRNGEEKRELSDTDVHNVRCAYDGRENRPINPVFDVIDYYR